MIRYTKTNNSFLPPRLDAPRHIALRGVPADLLKTGLKDRIGLFNPHNSISLIYKNIYALS